MLPEGLEKGSIVAAIGLAVAAAISGVTKIILKIAERWRTTDVVQETIVQGLHRTIKHQAEQINALEETEKELRSDLKAVRVEARKSAVDAYIMRAQIENFLIDFPHHQEWWKARLSKLDWHQG